jgi:hypothetical protein
MRICPAKKASVFMAAFRLEKILEGIVASDLIAEGTKTTLLKGYVNCNNCYNSETRLSTKEKFTPVDDVTM